MTITPTLNLCPAENRVTCEKSGHYICRVARDLHRMGQSNGDQDFDDWQITKPQRGAVLPLRCQCGSSWMIPSEFGGQVVHIDGFGWWPRKPGGSAPFAAENQAPVPGFRILPPHPDAGKGWLRRFIDKVRRK